MDEVQPAYPIVLTSLHTARCVVVGGGAVAERKLNDLLAGGARPTVISPTVTPALAAWRHEGRISHIARPFEEQDLDGAFLVVAATDDAAVNALVAAASHARGCLINAADDPSAGNFHTVATVRRGDLLLTVSTGGSSPVLAAHIRRELEERYGEAYARLTALFRLLRTGAARRLAADKRRVLWQRLVSDTVLGWLVEGRNDRATTYAYEQIALLEHQGEK